MASLKVSKRYAKNEFMTIGLILIIYCLFALYIPFIINELFSTDFMLMMLSTSQMEIIRYAIIIFGTIIPFSLMSLVGKRKRREKVKVKIAFSTIIVESFVFFTVSSLALFVVTSVAAYFGIAGEIVSSIGLTLDNTNMQNIYFVVTFIFLTPIAEEYAYRGIFLSTLSKYGKYFALTVTSFVFAVAHGSLVEMIPAFVMGYELSKIALKYKSYKPCIWIHMIFNAFLYLLFAVPEDYSTIMAILLALVYAITVIFVLNKHIQTITVKKPKSASAVTKMFVTTASVIFAIILFVMNSILTVLLR